MAIILLKSATTKGHYKGDALTSTWKKILAKVNTTQMQIKIKVSAKQIPWFIVDALMRGLLDSSLREN